MILLQHHHRHHLLDIGLPFKFTLSTILRYIQRLPTSLMSPPDDEGNLILRLPAPRLSLLYFSVVSISASYTFVISYTNFGYFKMTNVLRVLEFCLSVVTHFNIWI